MCVCVCVIMLSWFRTYVECGVTFDPSESPKPEDVSKLLQHSPILHAHKVIWGIPFSIHQPIS